MKTLIAFATSSLGLLILVMICIFILFWLVSHNQKKRLRKQIAEMEPGMRIGFYTIENDDTWLNNGIVININRKDQNCYVRYIYSNKKDTVDFKSIYEVLPAEITHITANAINL